MNECKQTVQYLVQTFSFSLGVFARGFLVCESKHGIGTIICRH